MSPDELNARLAVMNVHLAAAKDYVEGAIRVARAADIVDDSTHSEAFGTLLKDLAFDAAVELQICANCLNPEVDSPAEAEGTIAGDDLDDLDVIDAEPLVDGVGI